MKKMIILGLIIALTIDMVYAQSNLNGPVNISNTAADGYFLLNRNATVGNDSYLFHRISNNYHLIGSNKNGTEIVRKLGFAIGGGDTESDVKMTIDANGNVGIGTQTPSQKLEVNGGRIQVVIPGTNNYLLLNKDATNGNDSYFFHKLTSNYHILGSNKNGTGTLKKLGFSVEGGDLENDVKMTIDASGNVGIGTFLVANPNNYKLAVNGAIGAKAVHVENSSTTWPDYVFDKCFDLKPLSEVESFINENKHLPEVPSAADVKANGINLGEMDALLLKKIEELTLYMIEMKRENKEIKNENQEIKSKNAQIEIKNSALEKEIEILKTK